MIKAIKRFLTSLSIMAMLFTPTLAPVAVSAQIQEGLTCGTEFNPANIDDEGAECQPAGGVDASERIGDIVRLVINIFSWIVGIVAVIMIIVGGLKYITSGGDSGNVTGAKNTILYAVVGLVVVALAQFVVRFVLDKVTQ